MSEAWNTSHWAPVVALAVWAWIRGRMHERAFHMPPLLAAEGCARPASPKFFIHVYLASTEIAQWARKSLALTSLLICLPFQIFQNTDPGHLRWRNERLCVLLLAQVSELMSNIALSLSVSQIQLRFLHITPSSYRRHSNLKPWQCRMDQSENNLSSWGYFQGVIMRSYHGSFRTQPVLDRPLIAPLFATEQEGYVGWGFLWWFITTSMFEFWARIYNYIYI